MRGLTEKELAERAGVTVERIETLVSSAILMRGPGDRPFSDTDVRRVRLAGACEDAGLALDAIGVAIRAGRPSFGFLDHPPYQVLAEHARQTFAELAEERSLPLDLVLAAREALGFARPLPPEPVRDDDLKVLALVKAGIEFGLNDTMILRLLRVYGDSLGRIAEAEGSVYRRSIQSPLLQAGETTGQMMEQASEVGGWFVPLLEDMLVAVYHRQQERTWTQNIVEGIELALEEEGLRQPLERPSAMCFLDLVGYSRLTEERGDQAAAGLAATLGDVVQATAVEHGGRPVKWLGDGVMSFFPDPAEATRAALEMVGRARTVGLPAAHVGLAAGRVVYQDGDYFGRIVNLAARIAGRAGPEEVLVSDAVVTAAPVPDIGFEAMGPIELKGFSAPVHVFRASRAF